MKYAKRILWIAVLAGAAGLLYWSFRPQPVWVETARIEKGEFVESVVEDGKTRVRERYTVSAPVAGQLQRIALKPGDIAEPGALLAVITPAAPALLDTRTRKELTNRVGAAQAGLLRSEASEKRATANRDLAHSDYQRIKPLGDSGDVSRQDLERAETALRASEQELEALAYGTHAAVHDLAMAKAALEATQSGKAKERFEIRSPAAGRILRVIQESEGVVATGQPLLELADPSDLEIVVDVLTTDAVRFPAGADVLITGWGGKETLTGKVRRVEPTAFTKISSLGVEELRVNVIVDILSPPEQWKSLADGYRVDVGFIVSRKPDSVLAPVGALFREGEHWAAFVVRDGRAAKVPVEALSSNGRFFRIESGLSAGDEAVVYPPANIKEGDRLDINRQD